MTETGWGEFEVVIKIYFLDPTERPVTIYHILKLFQSPVLDGDSASLDSKKGLVSEQYEEIVFQEPTQFMQQLLENVQPLTNNQWKHDTDFEDKKIKTLQSVNNCKERVKAEIAVLKEKLKLVKDTITMFKGEILKVQEVTVQT